VAEEVGAAAELGGASARPVGEGEDWDGIAGMGSEGRSRAEGGRGSVVIIVWCSGEVVELGALEPDKFRMTKHDDKDGQGQFSGRRRVG
jgi:hypothetical protein